MFSKNSASLVWAEIDLQALKNNFHAIRRSLKNPAVGVLAVVKADAYGHGMVPVAGTLWKEGASFFGVANIDEALLLRRALPRARILTLGSFHPRQIVSYISNQITPMLSCLEDASFLNRALEGKSVFPAHVKIDTGMGRLGLPHRETKSFFEKLRRFSNIRIEGVYTHFSSADEPDAAPTRRQLRLFAGCLKEIHALGVRPRLIHASNSMGMSRFSEAHFNLVRPGLFLYGLRPSLSAKPLPGMRPVLSWRTRIAFLKPFRAGQTVSYGRTHRVAKNTLIAVLPVGYSHGYRVAFSNRSFVLIRGRRCPVVGRVTMDQILVDVGQVKGVRRWDEAVLIGAQAKQKVSAEELASLAGSISYEIVCSIHSRVPRIYKNA